MPKHKFYRKYYFLLAGIFTFISNITLAQINIPVAGLVVSADKELPLDGVTVSIENKGIGSVTNGDGKFIIVLHADINQADSLTFSYVGCYTKKVSLADASANSNLIVKLETSVINLKEVEVKPLPLRSLLNDITFHNSQLFISPVELKGYYREMVYTNSRCTEFSDALCAYYFNRESKPAAQFKIDASRCLTAKEAKFDRHNFEGLTESFIGPNDAFRIAMVAHLIEDYLGDKAMANYDYVMEQTTSQSEGDLKVVISPKQADKDSFYQLTLFLKNDLTVLSFHLDIPEKSVSLIKEKSFLGIHVRLTKLSVTVNYSSFSGRIYPGYYDIDMAIYVHGKFLGTTFNQTIEDKSEFVASEVNNAGNIKPFERKTVYKKGNICDNGTAMNDALLKNYTMIKLSQKDSVAIQSFVSK